MGYKGEIRATGEVRPLFFMPLRFDAYAVPDHSPEDAPASPWDDFQLMTLRRPLFRRRG